jgi:aminopeptidase N
LLTSFNNDQKLAELSMAHAVAHAAFPSPRPWIYEGVAHFAQALWREHENGRQAALDFMGLHRTALSETEARRTNKREGQSLVSTADEELYRSKAMFVFWMLHDMIGERALKKALAAYRVADDHDPSYMPGLIQAQSTRDLQWFFEDWVYHDRGLPDFRVASVYASKTEKGIYLVTVTIENLGEAGAEVPFTVRFDGGEVTKRLEVRGKKQATIRVETPGVPTEVVVNDGSVSESNMGNNVFSVVKK